MLVTPPRRAVSTRNRQAFEPVMKRPCGLVRLDASPINETQPKVSPGVKREVAKSASKKVAQGSRRPKAPQATDQFLQPGEACPCAASGTVFHA